MVPGALRLLLVLLLWQPGSITAVAHAAGGGRPGDAAPALRDRVYLETNQGVLGSSVAVGVLPVNRGWLKLLLLQGYENRRRSHEQYRFLLDLDSHVVRFEPQLQLGPLDHGGPLRRSSLFLRMQNELVVDASGGPITFDTTVEVVHKLPDEVLVLRANLGIRDLAGSVSRQTRLALAPFVKTPAITLPLLGTVRLRFAPEYTRDFSGQENLLLLHGKLEGTLRRRPWWGWSVQTFWAVKIQANPARRDIQLDGIYLWSGAVLPERWPGAGFFLEGGIWLGRDALDGGSSMVEALVLGLHVKLKFGTECRWWQ